MFWSKKSSFLEKLSFLILTGFLTFPVIDYIFRSITVIPIISALWHNVLLMFGLVLVGMRLLFGNPARSTVLSKAILALVLVGIGYLTLDLSTLSINFEGFRAIFQYMFVFFVAFYLNDRPENTKSLITWAVVISTLMAVYGIYQWVFKVPMPGHWIDSAETVRTRAWSITTSPNALGSHMAMMASLAVGLFMEEKMSLKKWLWLGAAGLMALCLIFTYSRGAWMAFAGAIAIIGVLYDRRILIVGVIAAVIAVLFVPPVTDRITYLFSSEYIAKSSASGRISRWFAAYDQMRNSPLFGSGLGHFGGAVASRRNLSNIYVDNYYLKSLAEMGLMGFTLFIWLILKTLRQGYRAMQPLASPRLRFIAAGILGGLLVIAVHNLVENIFEIPYLNIYFWLMAGLLMALPFNASANGGEADV